MWKFWITVMAITLSSCIVTQRKCEKWYDQATQIGYDAIIVPGIPYDNSPWDKAILKERLFWSKHLYENNITKHIIFSGGAVYTPYYESKIMALYAKELGIPDSVIHIETRAEHSTENVYYSYHKAKKLGFDKIAVATDPYQTRLVKRFTKKHVHESVAFVPFVHEILSKSSSDQLPIDIKKELAIDKDFVPAIKRQPLYKRIQGARGKNIQLLETKDE